MSGGAKASVGVIWGKRIQPRILETKIRACRGIAARCRDGFPDTKLRFRCQIHIIRTGTKLSSSIKICLGFSVLLTQ